LTDNIYEKAIELLKKCMNEATSIDPADELKSDVHAQDDLDTILTNAESSKAVLAVTITSLVKKVLDPDQDIRLHQEKMKDGYSGRTLDTNAVTPFLKDNNFPAMASSGWLTRSLEQSSPYTLDYKGAIRPENLKMAFLQTLYRAEEGRLDAREALVYLLSGLIRWRDEQTSIPLPKPVGLPIRTIVSYLHDHFTHEYHTAGAARLPVLAIYAAYEVMMKEVARFKGCTLKKLESHTSADRRSGMIGDIQVMDENGRVFEAVEVKHGIEITPDLIREAYAKFRTEPVRQYYLLTTSDKELDEEKITRELVKVSKEHGCQVIVNGVEPTILYYLRLLKNTDNFVSAYVELVEKDPAIKFEHKRAWIEIVTSVAHEK
jgi:DNA (cytosine-5)-methyltransferase 1